VRKNEKDIITVFQMYKEQFSQMQLKLFLDDSKGAPLFKLKVALLQKLERFA
jgi:hypothetical protein